MADKRWMILPIIVLTTTVTAQEARDIFKTEIFLTPYSEVGDRQTSYPNINARILALTGYTHYFGIRDDSGQVPRSQWGSTQPQGEGAFVVQLTERLSVRTKVALNSLTQDMHDNFFSDLGIELNNIFLAYTADNYALYGGKIDVGYGDAWHVIDGLYSGFTENSEYRDVVGLGARHTLGSNSAGTHSVAAIWFKRDDSSLTKRWSFDDGMLDTENHPALSNKLKSFVLSYDVRNFAGIKGVSAGIDIGRVEARFGFQKSANLVSTRLRYDTDFHHHWRLGWYNEATYASAYQGIPVSNGSGVSSISLSRDRWQLVFTGALRKMISKKEVQTYGLHSNWDWAVSGTATYVLNSGIIAQAGLVHQRNQGLTINQGVIRLAYQLEL